LKRSVQKVHWKSRGASFASAFGARVGSLRRRRLSFDFRLFIDPRECREPYEYAELWDPSDPDDIPVSPVSNDEIEGALKTEKLPVLSFEVSLR
jgi:hypothetical protein